MCNGELLMLLNMDVLKKEEELLYLLGKEI